MSNKFLRSSTLVIVLMLISSCKVTLLSKGGEGDNTNQNKTPATLSSSKDITSFSVREDPTAIVNIGENTVDIIVSYGTKTTSMTPTIDITGESIFPRSGTVRSFENTTAYTVTAEDGSTKIYSVSVSVPPYPDQTRIFNLIGEDLDVQTNTNCPWNSALSYFINPLELHAGDNVTVEIEGTTEKAFPEGLSIQLYTENWATGLVNWWPDDRLLVKAPVAAGGKFSGSLNLKINSDNLLRIIDIFFGADFCSGSYPLHLTKFNVWKGDLPCTEVTFYDAVLEAEVRAALVTTEKFCKENTALLESLTGLNAPSKGISDLTGLENFTNLQYLTLNFNNISDLTPLAGLTKLTSMDVGGNQITNVTPLAELTNLTTLSLWGNSISNIDPLSGLTNLTALYLEDNYISSITTALYYMTKLERLSFYNYNKVDEFDHGTGNSISDISVLARLTNLKWLYLYRNEISDISALAGLTNLTDLHLYGNHVEDITPLMTNRFVNGGLMGTSVDITNNPLSEQSRSDAQTLSNNGVNISW